MKPVGFLISLAGLGMGLVPALALEPEVKVPSGQPLHYVETRVDPDGPGGLTWQR